MYRDVMLWIGWLAVVVIAGCGQRDDPANDRGSAAPQTPRDAAASAKSGSADGLIKAAHGAQIAVVAVSDGGEVALSIDESGGSRFWPALDGTREPVVVRGMTATDLAIVRDGDGWRAAMIDSAQGLAVLRLDREGAVRERTLIAAEPGFAELAGGRELLLARRVDHVIVRLDVAGARPLSSEHGDQVLAIAARGSFAIAGIADREHPGEIATVRRIEHGAQLAWGPPIQLPVPLRAPIVISPDGRRLGGVHARTRAGVVIGIADARLLATDVVGRDDGERPLGFLDAERVAFGGGVVIGASRPVVADPWSGTQSPLRVRVGPGAAVADGVVVSGFATHLVLADPERNRFLGYRDVGVGLLQTAGGDVTFAMGDRLLWLDDRLRLQRALSLTGANASLHVIDDRRILKGTVITPPDSESELQLAILDATTGSEAVVGSWSTGVTIVYEPATRMIAGFMRGKLTQRAQLDGLDAPMTLRRPLRTRPSVLGIELLDPAVADGVIAIAHAYEEDGGLRLETFIEDPGGAGPIAPATNVTLQQVTMLGIDRTGVAYVLSIMATPRRIVTGWRHGKRIRDLAFDSVVVAGAVEPRGTALAFVTETEVFAVELDGAVRWRVPAWRVNALRYSTDGATLYVTTQGGLLALDSATGQRRATGCAWSFGMSALEPPAMTFAAPIVCAESE